MNVSFSTPSIKQLMGGKATAAPTNSGEEALKLIAAGLVQQQQEQQKVSKDAQSLVANKGKKGVKEATKMMKEAGLSESEIEQTIKKGKAQEKAEKHIGKKGDKGIDKAKEIMREAGLSAEEINQSVTKGKAQNIVKSKGADGVDEATKMLADAGLDKETIKGTIKKGFDRRYSGFSGFFRRIGDGIKSIGKAIGNAIKAVGSAIKKAVTSVVGFVGNTIAKVADGIGLKGVGNAVRGVTDVVKNVVGKAAGFVVDAVTSLASSAVDVISGVGKMLSAGSVGAAFKGLGQAVMGAVDIASTVMTGGGAAVAKQGVKQAVKTVAKEVGKGAAEAAAMEAATTAATKGLQAAKDAAKKAEAKVNNDTAEAAKAIASDLSAKAEAAKGAAAKLHAEVLANKISDKLGAAVKEALGPLGSAPSARLGETQINKLIDSALNQAEKAPDDLANSLVKFLEAVAEKEKVNQIRNAINEIMGSVDDLGSAIKDALPDLKKAISEQPNETKGMVEKVVGALADKVAKEGEGTTAAPGVKELAPVAKEVLEPKKETITVDKQLFEDMVKALEESKKQEPTTQPAISAGDAEKLTATLANPTVSAEDAEKLTATLAKPTVSAEDAEKLTATLAEPTVSAEDAETLTETLAKPTISAKDAEKLTETLAKPTVAVEDSEKSTSNLEPDSFEDSFKARANELGDDHKATFNANQKSIDDAARAKVGSEGSGSSTSASEDLVGRGKEALAESETPEKFEESYKARANELGDGHKATFNANQKSIDDAARAEVGSEGSGSSTSASEDLVGRGKEALAESETPEKFEESYKARANELGDGHKATFNANQKSIDDAARAEIGSQSSGLATSETDDLVSRGRAALSEAEATPEKFEESFKARAQTLGDSHTAQFNANQKTVDNAAKSALGQQPSQGHSSAVFDSGASPQQATNEQSFIDSFMQQANQLGQAHQNNFLANQKSTSDSAQAAVNGEGRLQF